MGAEFHIDCNFKRQETAAQAGRRAGRQAGRQMNKMGRGRHAGLHTGNLLTFGKHNRESNIPAVIMELFNAPLHVLQSFILIL